MHHTLLDGDASRTLALSLCVYMPIHIVATCTLLLSSSVANYPCERITSATFVASVWNSARDD